MAASFLADDEADAAEPSGERSELEYVMVVGVVCLSGVALLVIVSLALMVSTHPVLTQSSVTMHSLMCTHSVLTQYSLGPQSVRHTSVDHDK